MPGHKNLKCDVYLQAKNQLIYCKLVALGTLSMPGYAHPKRCYQLVENFRVYLLAKSQPHPLRFSGDIAKILKIYFGYFGHV